MTDTCQQVDMYCALEPCTISGSGACQTWETEVCYDTYGQPTYYDHFVQCNCVPGTDCW